MSIIPDGRLTEKYLEFFKESVNADANPVVYLSGDPGKANGICGYDAKYYLLFMLTIHADDIVQFLEIFDHVKICIIEDYLLYPNKAKKQIYSDMETSRVIGRFEAWADRKLIELIKQPASIKPTGYAWIGKKQLSKSNPDNHKMDAHVHFMYWAIKNGKIDVGKLLKKESDEQG